MGRQRQNSPENTVGRSEAGTPGSPATVWTNLREPTMCSAQDLLILDRRLSKDRVEWSSRELAALRLITNSQRVVSSKGISACQSALKFDPAYCLT